MRTIGTDAAVRLERGGGTRPSAVYSWSQDGTTLTATYISLPADIYLFWLFDGPSGRKDSPET